MQIEISSRHGSLEPAQSQFVRGKAEKLVRLFDRVMAIEVAVDHGKHGKPFWFVEIRVSAEHKHDFFASEEGQNLEMVTDACIHKIEQQLRRYKEKIQHHKGDLSPGRVLE